MADGVEMNVSTGDHSSISPGELSRRLQAGERMVVLDIREQFERATCMITVPATSVDLYIPMNSLPGRIDEVSGTCALGQIVVYCHHGVRSRMVVDWLLGNGLSGVANLEGGIAAWSETVDPSVRRY